MTRRSSADIRLDGSDLATGVQPGRCSLHCIMWAVSKHPRKGRRHGRFCSRSCLFSVAWPAARVGVRLAQADTTAAAEVRTRGVRALRARCESTSSSYYAYTGVHLPLHLHPSSFFVSSSSSCCSSSSSSSSTPPPNPLRCTYVASTAAAALVERRHGRFCSRSCLFSVAWPAARVGVRLAQADTTAAAEVRTRGVRALRARCESSSS